MTELKLEENWNVPMLTRVANAVVRSGDARLQAPLTRILSEMDMTTGTLSTAYTHGKGTPFGRLYAYPSLQSIPGWIRRLCSFKVYHDVDIENCFPVILRQIAQHHGVRCPLLTRYVQNRQRAFERVRQELPGTTEWSRAQLKKCFLIVLHGGDYTYNVTAGAHSEFLDAFDEEIRTVSDNLQRLPAFADMVQRLNQRDDKTNKQGTFIGWICQQVECEIILAVRLYLEQHGRRVGVLVFDGLMVLADETGFLPADILRGAEAHVWRATGFSIHLVEKSLEPTAEDYEHLRQLEEAATPAYFQAPAWRVKQQDDEYVQDINFDGMTRAILINASMGLGKSTAAKRYIEQHQPRRILVVTARCQQAETLLGHLRYLGFQHYAQVEGAVSEVDRLIIQYESLHKLMADPPLRPYDLLLIDEIRAVAGQICCQATNKQNLRRNAVIFKAVSQASRCLWMDADLEYDGMVKILAEEMWHVNEVQICRYTRIALQRQLALMTEVAWLQALLRALTEEKRIMVGFRTKRAMDTVRRFLQQHLPDISMLAFSADSTKADMQAFQDINAEVARIQLLCFTSKVTVGADIQTPIDQVFLHAKGGGGCCPRDMFQMTGRARQVLDPIIRVVLPKGQLQPDDDPVDQARSPQDSIIPRDKAYAATCRKLLSQRQLRERYLQVVNHVEPTLIDGTFQWTADWITKLLACYLAEQNANFTTEFLSLARDKGYEITVLEPGPIAEEEEKRTQEELKEAATRLSNEHQDMQQDVWHNIQNTPKPEDNWDNEMKMLEQRCQNGQATPAEKIRLSLLRTCSRFPGHYEHMTLENVQGANECMGEFYKVHALNAAADVNELRFRDAGRLQHAPLPELTKLSYAQMHCTNQAITTVGFQSMKDYETKVPAEAFQDHADQVLRLCTEAATLENRRPRRPKARDAQTQAVGALRRELRKSGHTLRGARKRKRGAREEGEGDNRYMEYRIQLKPEIRTLLPHFVPGALQQPKVHNPVDYDLLPKRRRIA